MPTVCICNNTPASFCAALTLHTYTVALTGNKMQAGTPLPVKQGSGGTLNIPCLGSKTAVLL